MYKVSLDKNLTFFETVYLYFEFDWIFNLIKPLTQYLQQNFIW